MGSCSPPALPTRTLIWQRKRQQLIDRLAAKGIHISEDDPRLAEPVMSDGSEDSPLIDIPPAEPANDSPSRQISALPARGTSQSRRDYESPAGASQPAESLLIGPDPASELRRRRQQQETQRRQLQEQILEKQRRLEVERIQKRMQLLSKTNDEEPRQLPPSASDEVPRPATPSDLPNALPSIAMVGSDPVVERQRRKQMQAEMNKVLREQIREKSIMERMARASSATGDLSSSTRTPFVNNFASPSPHRLRTPEQGSVGRTPVSIAALDRDPEQEVARRRRSQADLNSYLRSQIDERRSRKSSQKSTPVSTLESPFPSRERQPSRWLTSPESSSDHESTGFAACTPLACHESGSLLFSGRADSPGTVRRKKMEYAEALQQQMMQSPPNKKRLEFSGRSPQTSRGSASLLLAGQADSPETVRRKKKEYGEALRHQMLMSPDSHDALDQEISRFNGKGCEPQGVLLSGDKVETPDSIRRKQRDYAEVLQLQIQERRQRRLQDKAEQERIDRKYDSREGSNSQTTAASLSDFSTPDRAAGQRPSKCLEGQRSETNLDSPPLFVSKSPGSVSSYSIFNHDPVKVAIDQKLQRKQLGEELQRQMDEQRRRKEESRIKEQRENQEDHNRILRQLQEMNRSYSSSDISQQKRESKSERVEEISAKADKERVTKDAPALGSPRSQESRASREYHGEQSPVRARSPISNVDWNQTEAQVIRPLRELRNKLSLGSEELRQRIAQQRQIIQAAKAKADSDFDEHSSSLPNSSSWLPVEPESERQLPVQSKFVQVPTFSCDQYPQNLDEDALEQFVNESENPFSRPCSSNSSKRRPVWGPPVFPSAMPSSEFYND